MVLFARPADEEVGAGSASGHSPQIKKHPIKDDANPEGNEPPSSKQLRRRHSSQQPQQLHRAPQ